MSTPYEVVGEIYDVLSGDATLSAGVSQFLIGAREIDSLTSFPVIMIEPVSDEEREVVYTKAENILTVNIMGIIQSTDKEGQVEELMGLVNSVKKALDSNRTLNGKAAHLVIGTTTYNVNFPLRMFTLQCNILYEQRINERS